MKQKTPEKKTKAPPPAPPAAPASTPNADLASALSLGAVVLFGVFLTVRPLSQFTPYAGEAAIAGLVAIMLMVCVGGRLLIRRDPATVAPDVSFVLLQLLALWIGLFLFGAIRSPNLGAGIPAATSACIYGGLLLASFCLARTEPRMAGIVTRILIAMIAVEAFSGIWQYFVDLPRLRNLVATDKLELPVDMQSGAGMARLGGDRIFATFGNPNSLAGYLLIGIFLLAGILVEARRRVVTVAALVLLALMGVALALTGSKGGALAGAAGAWFFAAQWLAHRHPKFRSPLIAVTAGGLVLAVGLLAAGFSGKLGPRPFGLSLEVRFDYWRAAMRMWREHPLTGVGLGGFAENYLYYKTALGTEVKDAHNDYVQLATELGVMGPVAYVLMWWLVLKPAAGNRVESAEGESERRASMLEKCALLGGIVGLFMMMFGFMAFNTSDVVELFSRKADRAVVLGAIETLALLPVFACAVIVLRPSPGTPAVTPGWIQGVRAAIGAVLIHQLVDFDFRCEATMTAILILGGMLWASRSAAPANPSVTVPSSAYRPAGLALVVLAVALIPTAAWIPVQSGNARAAADALESDAQELAKKYDRSDYQKVRGDIVEERKRACDSASFDPEAWADLAMAYEFSPDARQPGTRKLALQCFERNAQLRPFSPVPQWMLGNFYIHHAFQDFVPNDPQATLPLFESARKAFAAAAERYPYCPGIRLWEGDAVLMTGDVNEAGRLYAQALYIDTQIDDTNVRLAAIFNDPRPGAFARHNFDPLVLRVVEGTLVQDNPNPPPDFNRVQSGLLLRRIVALAWMIRQNESSHALDAAALEQKRQDLIHSGELLIDTTPEFSDRAHAAWLWALSFQMASKKDAPRAAEAWEKARQLQKESAASGVPGTPPFTFESMEFLANQSNR